MRFICTNFIVGGFYWIRWKAGGSFQIFRKNKKLIRCVHNKRVTHYLMHPLKNIKRYAAEERIKYLIGVCSIRWRSNLCSSSWSMTSVFIRADAAPIVVSPLSHCDGTFSLVSATVVSICRSAMLVDIGMYIQLNLRIRVIRILSVLSGKYIADQL